MKTRNCQFQKSKKIELHKDKNHIMLRLWQEGQATAEELSNITGLHINDVIGELEELQNRGRVIQIGKLYQLLTPGEEIIRRHVFDIIRLINRDKRNQIIELK